MTWEKKNLAHRYTQSYFINEYNENADDVYRDGVLINELNFSNMLASAGANSLSVITVASGLIRFFVKNGIPTESGKDLDDLYNELIELLSDPDNALEDVANKMDSYFLFFNE